MPGLLADVRERWTGYVFPWFPFSGAAKSKFPRFDFSPQSEPKLTVVRSVLPGPFRKAQEWGCLGAVPAIVHCGRFICALVQYIWSALPSHDASPLPPFSPAFCLKCSQLTKPTSVGHHIAEAEENMPIPGLVAQAHGVVLELGACTGNQVPRLDASKLRHVYGIEPNRDFEAQLGRRVRDAGLEARYTPVWARLEDAGAELERLGVRRGEVDCVLSVQVLCSVDRPEEVVRDIFEWLRPGGELIFCEHGISHDPVTRIVQRKEIQQPHYTPLPSPPPLPP